MGLSASSLSMELESDLGKTEDKPLPAGSKLRGSIIVNIHRNVKLPLEAEDASEVPAVLRLRVYGKEKVCMDRGKAKIKLDTQKGRWQRPRGSAERQILDHTLRWSKFPNVDGFAENNDAVLAGVYVFPFEIDLPLMLPSSTYFPLEAVSTLSKRGCRVQYKMDAQLSYGDSKVAKSSNYLWVCAANGTMQNRRQATPCMVEPIAHEVNGMLQKGNIYFGAAVDDCTIRKGEDIVLRVSCRNDSPASIHRVQVNLYEKLTWGTTATNQVDPRTGICSQTATLQQQAQVPLFALKDAKLPSLGKEAKGLFKSAYNSILGVEQARTYQREIYRDLVTGHNVIKIPVPETSKISYTGQLVKVEHVIEIQFFTSSFSKNPLLEIPVHVLPSATPIVDVSSSERPSEPYCKECFQTPPAPITANTGLADDAPPQVSAVVMKPESEPGIHCDGSGQTSEEEEPSISTPAAPTEPAVAITSDVLVLGGDATLVKHRRYPASLAPSAPPSYLDDAAPIPPPKQVSVPDLQREMRSAISCHNVILSKIEQPAWTDFFQELSADGLGMVISSVNPAVDQPRIAVLLAPLLNNGRGISSQQIAAAIRNCNVQHRAAMAQRLLPLCTDHNLKAIRAELNEWEQTVAYNAFGEAEKRLSNKKAFLVGGKSRVAIAS